MSQESAQAFLDSLPVVDALGLNKLLERVEEQTFFTLLEGYVYHGGEAIHALFQSHEGHYACSVGLIDLNESSFDEATKAFLDTSIDASDVSSRQGLDLLMERLGDNQVFRVSVEDREEIAALIVARKAEICEHKANTRLDSLLEEDEEVRGLWKESEELWNSNEILVNWHKQGKYRAPFSHRLDN